MNKTRTIALLFSLFATIILCSCKENASKDETITTHLHNFEVVEEVEANCLESGYKKYLCDCGETKTEYFVSNEHTPGLKQIENEVLSTCAECGYCDVVIKCELCGTEIERNNVELEKLPHTAVIDEGVSPACLKSGLTEGSHCEVCGEILVKQETIDSFEHKLLDPVIINEVEATCSKKGYYEMGWFCERCGEMVAYKTESTGYLSHNLVTDPRVEPTCASYGYTEKVYCTNCSYVETYSSIIDKLKHTGEWKIEIEPSQNDEGIRYKICDVCGFKESEKLSAIYSEGIEFELSKDGTHYIVSGVGTYNGKEVIIPGMYSSKPVLEIASNAFKGCKAVTNISLPNTIENIGSYAFASTNITTMILNDGVKTVWDNAFENCTKLTEVYIPSTVTQMGECLFMGCSNLKKVSIPFAGQSQTSYRGLFVLFGNSNNEPSFNSVSEINFLEGCKTVYGSQFQGMTSLKKVSFPKTIEKFEKYAFGNFSSIEEITIPYIGESRTTNNYLNFIFGGDIKSSTPISLETVNILEGCTEIPDSAFSRFSSLVAVNLPEGVTAIGAHAFEACSSLVSIGMPTTIKTIGNNAFSNCSSLASIDIPNTVETIGGNAFSNCSSLSKIVLPFVGSGDQTSEKIAYVFNGTSVPKGVNEIVLLNAPQKITKEMFSGCYTVEKIVLPEMVTEIEEEAFANFTALKSVNIPTKVKVINKNTFYNCTITSIELPLGLVEIADSAFERCRIKSVVIPEGVVSLGNNCFKGSSIRSIVLPDSVITIGESAFAGSKLISIEVPSSVKTIGNSAFSDCIDLSSIILPSSIVSLGDNMFNNCIMLSEANLPEGLKTIGENAFSGCEKLVTITIPSTVESLGNNAFLNCSALKDINISNGLKTIGENAFSGCVSLESINLPDTVTRVGSKSFYGLTSLKTAKLSNAMTIIEKELFNGSANLISVIGTSKIKTISDKAFCDCQSLELFESFESVEEIGNYAFRRCTNLKSNIKTGNVGNYAFDACSNIKEVDIYGDIGESAFNLCTSLNKANIQGTTAIGSHAFSGCSNLASIVLPDTLKSISYAAFGDCPLMKELYVPSSVASLSSITAGTTCLEKVTLPFVGTSIENGTKIGNIIANAEQIRELVILDGCQIIASGAFASLTNLVKAALPKTANVGDDAFNGCLALEELVTPNADLSNLFGLAHQFYNNTLKKVSILDSVTKIPERGFFGFKNLEEIFIPNSVTSIGNMAFNHCEKMTAFNLPDSIVSLGYSAFANCKSLESFVFPSNLNTISNMMFDGCNALKNVTLPTNLVSIGAEAFKGCSSLNNLTIPETVESIGSEAFMGCASFTEINIPKKVTVIESGTYSGCGLSELIIPEHVSTIKARAFENLKNVKEIIVPETVTYIGAGAFGNIQTLEKISLNFLGSSRETSNRLSYIFDSQSKDEFSPSIAPNLKEVIVKTDTIPYRAFYCFNTLEMLIINGNIAEVDDEAFYNCSNMTIRINGAKIERIGKRSFYGCSNSDISFDCDNVKYIHEYAFAENVGSVGNLEFSNISYLGDYAFNNSSSLKSFSFDSKWTGVVKANYFKNASNLEEIYIPNGATSFESSSFNGCSNLRKISLPFVGNVVIDNVLADEWPSRPAHTFGYIFGETVYDNSVSVTQRARWAPLESDDKVFTYQIPASLKEVHVNSTSLLPENAFMNCTMLEKATVESEYIGQKAFRYCSNLKDVTFLNEEKIRKMIFLDCTSLTDGSFPKVKTIGENAFKNCTGLIEFEFPPLAETIEFGAFYGCSNITSLYIPDSIQRMEKGCLNGLYNLETLNVPFLGRTIAEIDRLIEEEPGTVGAKRYNGNLGTLFGRDSYENSYKVYQSYTKYSVLLDLSRDTFYVPNTLKYVTVRDYNLGYDAFKDAKSLISVTLLNENGNLNSLKSRAFANCDNLEKIYLDKGCTSLASIGDSAFENCPKLTGTGIYEGFVMPNSISSVGTYLFKDCIALKSVTLSASLNSMNSNSFEGCESLVSFTILNPDFNLKTDYFKNFYNKITLKIAAGLETVFDGLYNVTEMILTTSVEEGSKIVLKGMNLAVLVIDDAITEIEKLEIVACDALKELRIGEKVTYIAELVISNSLELSRIVLESELCKKIGKVVITGCEKIADVSFDFVTEIGTLIIDRSSKAAIAALDGLTEIVELIIEDIDDIDWMNLIVNSKLIKVAKTIVLKVFDSISRIDFESLGNKITSITKEVVLDLSEATSKLNEIAINGVDIVTNVILPKVNYAIDSFLENFENLKYIDIGSNTDVPHFGKPVSIVISSNVSSSSLPETIIEVFYKGTMENWNNKKIVTSADVYFYSEEEPETLGNFWHYNESGIAEIWI